jgi:protein-disulfide isomerase
MKRMIFVGFVSALALAGCGGANSGAGSDVKNGAAAGPAAPAGTIWTETTSKTVDGGMLMGNPNAPVKLVEYGALTCSHCAAFAKEALSKLKVYVNKGTVSFEYRPFLLNPIDVPAALASRCSGAGPFFPIAEGLYETQGEWLAKTQTFTEAESKQISALPPEQAAGVIAAKLGLDRFVQQRGVSADKLKVCLSDKAAIDELVNITNRAQTDFKVGGTPTFVINGITAEGVGTWADLEPKLRDAGG